jgi:hypothetical protein
MDYLGNQLLVKQQPGSWLCHEGSAPDKFIADNSLDGRLYGPDEIAVESGIYEVLHARDHRDPHFVTIIRGEAFPDCDLCRRRVRYGLVRTAPYIFHDGDFQGGESDT